MISAENLQAEHYDKIAAQYAAHYNDKWSLKYRWRFINEPLFEGVELKGAKILEAMCGSGGITDFLIQKEADVTGLDISANELEIYKRNYPTCKTLCSSILDIKTESESFDHIVVVGGLHHLHPNLNAAIKEMHRVLKPGGYFCFAEPHKGSFFDTLRQQWYKHDKMFAENEEGIDVEEMKREFADMFEFKKENYCGNLAYLLVYNSMIFRIPLKLKPVYSPVTLFAESLIEKLQGRRTSCMVVAQWRKK